MIDIHSHIIFGVDDGPSNIKESIRMVLEAEKLGIRDIIATPHFNNLLLDTDKTVENFLILSSRIADCDVKLHIGYEVFINSSLLEKVKELRMKTLNNSSYILFELPFDHIPEYCSKLLYQFHLEKIIPILAHPERNRAFRRNFDSFINFIENGCLVQIDAGSIVGAYGKEAKNFAKKVIKLNLAQFVASDAHCTEDYRDWYLPAYNLVKQWGGEEYANLIFNENAQKILFDENVKKVMHNESTKKVVLNMSARNAVQNESAKNAVLNESVRSAVLNESTKNVVHNENAKNAVLNESVKNVVHSENAKNAVNNESAKNAVLNENAKNVMHNEYPIRIVFNSNRRRTIIDNPKG